MLFFLHDQCKCDVTVTDRQPLKKTLHPPRYINMYGCKRFGYYDLWGNPTSAFECNDIGDGDGWFAAAFFVALIIFGGESSVVA